MKKGTIAASGAAVVVAVAAGVYLMHPKATPPEVKNPVDTQYEQVCILLNDLNAKVQRPDANIDSLAAILKDVRWETVKKNDEYERQKRNLYLNNKKDVAMTFRKVYQERGMEITDSLFEQIEQISE